MRQAIGERFRVDDSAVANAIDGAIQRLHAPGDGGPSPNDAEREEMERRLVSKLQSAGQLRAGFLVRAVREKRLSLFEHALAVTADNALARNNLGAGLLEAGDVASARAQFERAVQLKPDFSAARNNLEKARSLRK